MYAEQALSRINSVLRETNFADIGVGSMNTLVSFMTTFHLLIGWGDVFVHHGDICQTLHIHYRSGTAGMTSEVL